MVPRSRWDIEQHYHPGGAAHRMYVRFGQWLDRAYEFDAAAFNLSKR